jgi:hypothetical protein
MATARWVGECSSLRKHHIHREHHWRNGTVAAGRSSVTKTRPEDYNLITLACSCFEKDCYCLGIRKNVALPAGLDPQRFVTSVDKNPSPLLRMGEKAVDKYRYKRPPQRLQFCPFCRAFDLLSFARPLPELAIPRRKSQHILKKGFFRLYRVIT